MLKFKTESPRVREFLFTLAIIKRSKVNLAALGIIATFYLMAIFAPWLTPYDPTKVDVTNKLAMPSLEHPLGTDHLGRDVLSRLIYGARTSMFIGIVVVVTQSIIGILVGLTAGYAGGKLDELLMRITDMFMAFPRLILAMLFAYILGRGIFSATFALSLVGWTSVARLVRSVAIVEKEKEYVTAAKVLGKSDFQILFGEILPNALHPVMVTATLGIGGTIVIAAGLSFIGVGVQPPTPDWGVMISDGYRFLMDQPWVALSPGVLIMLAVLGFNILGDALRDALDPRLRREIR